ncbi:STE/STE20/YSK protein kinase Nak1 [Schizosaccharomyces japonicus yFS275]|uniref:non-specific serine/threonine protein kinase n=1 Tax=Schizosaccharomyces japonicus (strain yFS275 / FY16936) TaxID=402676 RepID=B6K6W1_SCHJY|nr:STE/STE20/YSK protein kinase Nak1 [Schizosaccharomyces japonicus yFS275]EEB09265.1 STE/STE20/YSK protein kinase Nak1 [Schizosaccharomyces japonicus yFS275]
MSQHKIDTPHTKRELIGRGSYGSVFKGMHTKTKEVVAIKVLNLDTEEDEVSDIQKEIAVLSELKMCEAQNIIMYRGSYLVGTHLWIIMDYCQGGSVRTLMEAGSIDELHNSIIIRETLLALQFIHRAGIIHRDIKAANILISQHGDVKLCDFGIAAQLNIGRRKRTTFIGTPYWMAPEVIRDGQDYNYMADIWSLGITTYEIATGMPPFAKEDPLRAVYLVANSESPRLEGNFSSLIKEFVSLCLQQVPEERQSATELLKSKFIRYYSRSSTTELQPLIRRYERWKSAGGVRQSLAIGPTDDESGNSSGSSDELDSDEGWEFGTIKGSAAETTDSDASKNSEGQSVTDSYQETLKPTKNDPEASHPLMQLFQSNSPPPSAPHSSSNSHSNSTTSDPADHQSSFSQIELPTFDLPTKTTKSMAGDLPKPPVNAETNELAHYKIRGKSKNALESAPVRPLPRLLQRQRTEIDKRGLSMSPGLANPRKPHSQTADDKAPLRSMSMGAFENAGSAEQNTRLPSVNDHKPTPLTNRQPSTAPHPKPPARASLDSSTSMMNARVASQPVKPFVSKLRARLAPLTISQQNLATGNNACELVNVRPLNMEIFNDPPNGIHNKAIIKVELDGLLSDMENCLKLFEVGLQSFKNT